MRNSGLESFTTKSGLLYCLYIVSIFYVDFNTHDRGSCVLTGLECYVKLCQMPEITLVYSKMSTVLDSANVRLLKKDSQIRNAQNYFFQANIVQTLPY